MTSWTEKYNEICFVNNDIYVSILILSLVEEQLEQTTGLKGFELLLDLYLPNMKYRKLLRFVMEKRGQTCFTCLVVKSYHLVFQANCVNSDSVLE
jgi:hypothetical protein